MLLNIRHKKARANNGAGFFVLLAKGLASNADHDLDVVTNFAMFGLVQTTAFVFF